MNGRWLDPVRVHPINSFDDDCPDLIAKGPDDIWVGWEKYVTTYVDYIYVSHFDGLAWSQEEEIDDTTVSYFNGAVQMAFGNNEVWTVWDGYTVGVEHADVYCSRYLASALTEGQSKIVAVSSFSASPNPFIHYISFSYTKAFRGCIFFVIYDRCGKVIRTLVNREQNSGSYHLYWDGKDMNKKEIPDGIYFAVLKLGKRKEIKKIIKIE